MTGRQQCDGRGMGASTGARATRQVHLLRAGLIVQQCRQLPRIALGVGESFAATGRSGAGHQLSQRLMGVDQKTQRLQLLDDERGILRGGCWAATGSATASGAGWHHRTVSAR